MELTGNLELQLDILGNIDLAKIRDNNWILEKINNTILHAKKNNYFYNQLIDINKINSLEEINKLPFITKNTFKDQYPFGLLSTKKEELLRYGETSGTKGKNCSGFVTAHDWFENNLILFLGWDQIIDKKDKLIIAVPYICANVGADIDRVCELIGATAISAGALSICTWERVIELMYDLQATSIICSPSRVLRLAEMITKKGLDPIHDFNIKKVFCVGELLTEGKKKRIEKKWGASVYITYGMTEATSLASPCSNQRLHLCDYRYYSEVINPFNNETVKDGEPGELVLTSLSNQALPLIRYRTGDLITMEKTSCDCGLPFRTIKHYGRIDNCIEYKGNKIYYYEIENLLLSQDIDHNYKVEWSSDHFAIKISFQQNKRDFDIKSKIKELIEEKYGFTPSIYKLNTEEFHKEFDQSLKPGSIFFNKLP